MARQWREGELGGISLIAGGFILVAMSYGGYLIGALIGRHFGAQQTGAIIGLLFGVIVGFYDLYRIAVRVIRQQPLPTREQQQRAEDSWKKSDDDEKSEGIRDKYHE